MIDQVAIAPCTDPVQVRLLLGQKLTLNNNQN